MASITIRNLSPESKAKLRRRAERQGCSVEALARSILDQAAEDTAVATLDQAAEDTSGAPGFPDDLIALVEPGDDIEPFLREHRQPQEPVDLS